MTNETPNAKKGLTSSLSEGKRTTSDALDFVPSRDPGKWTAEDRRQYFRVLGRITLGTLTPRQIKRINRVDPTILHILRGLVK